jgi:uncharacterized repeat protein (TIGR01451 family)
VPPRAALIALVALLTFAPAASAVSLAPSNAPLPGSSFQAADGNHDNPSGDVSVPPDGVNDIDWQGLQAAHRVHHNPDPNAEDSAFVGGSKEDQPGAWALTSEAGGVNPNDANILDAWSAVDQPGANTFLYLGFARESGNGTTDLAFELNRDARLWNNGKAMVPCRRDGDILISYLPTGNTVEVVLQQWTTTTTDTATGCARTGRLTDSSAFTANQDVQAAMNSGTIQNYLPGHNPLPGTLADREFGEASLNLAKVLDQAFGDRCLAFSSIWMHSRSSNSESSNMQDYVAPRPLNIRTCAASGTKFYDLNANGVRDAGEPGIPRFLVWADYDNDGIKDPDEPFSVTDDHGHYVIYDIQPPGGSYMLRETLLTSRNRRLPFATDWTCSFPHAPPPFGMTGSAPGGRFGCAWGPIDANATPNASGRDFGNWYPATLTVKKQLAPADDPGRFDLLVNGEVVVPAAGDNASRTLSLMPGTYDVSEAAVSGTNADDYTSTVDCARDVNRRGRHRSGPSFTGLTLAAGQRATCVFHNVRKGTPPSPTPAIAIRKTGPAQATAGDTLHYKFYVTNPGAVAFPAAGVKVTDPACDTPPKLDSKLGPSGDPDSTPGTLDPGNPSDTWLYSCSHATSSGGANCQPRTVDNTGAVTGASGGATVSDDDSIATDLLCPKQPDPTPEPIPPQPGPGPNPQPTPPPNPDQPGPVEPPGPGPPDAGASGDAGIKVLAASRRGCLPTRLARVAVHGVRIASVSIYVDGHFRRTVTLRTLQRQTAPQLQLPPGRYRVSAHVTFQRGSATPPVTIAASVRVCAARRLPVRFTG